jgi:hypothetical protein
MTVEYAKLPPIRDGLTTIKCFYKHDGKYGEFYLQVDSQKRTIRLKLRQ